MALPTVRGYTNERALFVLLLVSTIAVMVIAAVSTGMIVARW